MSMTDNRSKSEDIVNEAKMLKDFVGGEFYIKNPVCGEGLKATMACKKKPV
jgi:transaldolase